MAKLHDSIATVNGALGDPSRDKMASAYFTYPFIDDGQLTNAYRGDWISRKIVNIPAEDSTREWREWQAKQDQIEAIENEENRLNYQAKIKLAQIKARLYGGGAVYLGTGEQNLEIPLKPEAIKIGGIKFMTALSRLDLKADGVDWDASSETFGQAEFYTISAGTGLPKRIHKSRLIIFHGAAHPEPKLNIAGMNFGWGDSVLVAAMDAIKQAAATFANVASLIHEANVDVINIPGFLDQVANADFESRLLKRFILAAQAKGIHGTLLLDEGETYERKGADFATLPDLMDKFMLQISGASDIPATRFVGMSPAGMSATGESDLTNYYDGRASYQKNDMTPAMHLADECLIRSALGSRPEEIYFNWRPLWQLKPVDKAAIGKQNSETIANIQRTGLIQDEALSEATINLFVESGFMPGLDQIVEEVGPVDFEKMEADKEEARQTELAATAAKAAPKPGFAKDMAPTSLYISRSVVNAKDIIAWAHGQGFDTTLTGLDMHVTIIFSRKPVDWFKVGESYSSKIEIGEGGPRAVEHFSGGAVVLQFACRELEWRYRDVIEAGASSEHEEYSPHITISYRADRIDVSKIEPYTGKIVLGPEIFKPVNDGWSATKTEN